jgi:hypothetical protein
MGEYPCKYFKKLKDEGKTEALKAISVKGGSVVGSMKVKYAAHIREWKKQGLPPERIDRLLERVVDPEANMMDIEKELDIAKNVLDEDKYISLRNTVHRTRFGDKHTVNSLNVNINIEHQEVLDHLQLVFGDDNET